MGLGAIPVERYPAQPPVTGIVAGGAYRMAAREFTSSGLSPQVTCAESQWGYARF